MTAIQELWIAVYRDALAHLTRDGAEEAANAAVDAFTKKFPVVPLPARVPDRA